MTMAVLFAAALAAAPAVQTAPANPVIGTWLNPKGNLQVRTAACGGLLCGTIVWAGPKPVADAKKAGVDQLVGTTLLRDYHATGSGQWAGHVFIPDLGRTFSSRIRQTGPNRLTVSGCLIAGFLCRSQEWRRVS